VSAADGTSNTLMLGEALGGKFPGLPRDYAHSWFASSAWPVAFGMPEANTSASAYLRWGSNHTGVSNFCYVDGSVRPVRKGESPSAAIGSWTYRFRQLAGYRDGRVDTVSELTGF
jgi:prepilin-type processing-associated H-X9-DG protein